MRAGFTATLIVGALASFALTAYAYPPRQDLIWARSTLGAPITLDGKLDEPAWASAESHVIQYKVDSGIPGSGWQEEGGLLATDKTDATIKFLVVGNQLYMGAVIKDKSIGGSTQFNRFDGLLMAIKDHSLGQHPAPPAEYLYSWWNDQDPNAADPGKMPIFIGAWANLPHGSPRSQEQIDNWDAVTVVHGTTNTDAVDDTSYVVEMRFYLTPMGYDVTQPSGDIVEWNGSIYDCDWVWPTLNPTKFSVNRTWWQSPWGNDHWYHEVRICARPDVTISSGPVPEVAPELIIPNAAGYLPPTIDGSLTEPVWASAPSFDIRYGDDALRASYPGVAQWRAGQFQPTVNGAVAAVIDPGDCTVKYFFKEDTLYLGFDVRDQVVQYHTLFDRWDGFIISINDRGSVNRDHVLNPRRLSFQVGPTGQALARDYLPYLRDTLFGAKVAIHLNPGTTVDTTGDVADNGYTAELALDLTKLGYPHGRGDGLVFLGIDMLDGDSFQPITDSYGTRTWWFREYEGEASSSWAYMDVGVGVTAVSDLAKPGTVALRGNYPNPFGHFTTLRFSLARPSRVGLEVYDVQGRMVSQQDLGVMTAGDHHAAFGAPGLVTGLYLYRLKVSDPSGGSPGSVLSGKMMFVK